MRQLLFLLIVSVFSFSAFSQTKSKKELVVIVDSADAASFLTLLQVGTTSLMTTDIPAKQVTAIANYGQSLFQKNLTIYQSWFPRDTARQKPPVVDSLNKKPVKP